MFRTYPDAELSIPLGLAINGERSWQWLELGLKTMYFFVTAESDIEGEGTFIRHLWFSRIDQVIQIADQCDAQFHLVRIDLFSPGYINGSDVYQLDQVKQVWRHKKISTMLHFMLVDGRSLWYGFGDDPANLHDMELILAV